MAGRTSPLPLGPVLHRVLVSEHRGDSQGVPGVFILCLSSCPWCVHLEEVQEVPNHPPVSDLQEADGSPESLNDELC